MTVLSCYVSSFTAKHQDGADAGEDRGEALFDHECWDGTGYPDRLSGDAIPLGARLLGIVDCYDALTSDRPYRPALSHQTELEARAV